MQPTLFSDAVRRTMNEAIYKLIINFLHSDTPFAILISNKNWSQPLPENLLKQPYFFIQIKEDALQNSYYDEDNDEIIINTLFGNTPNNIILHPEDVKAIFDVSLQIPYINKNYDETPYMKHIENVKKIGINPLSLFEDSEVTPEIVNSMNCFVQNNPNLFNKN